MKWKLRIYALLTLTIKSGRQLGDKATELVINKCNLDITVLINNLFKTNIISIYLYLT